MARATQNLAEEVDGTSGFFGKHLRVIIDALKRPLRKTAGRSPRAATPRLGQRAAASHAFRKANGKVVMACPCRSKRPEGATALECASSGDVYGVKLRLNLGGKVGERDPNHNTALHLAAEGGYAEVVTLLLYRGANPNARNVMGETALHLAAANGHVDAVKALLENNALVDAKDCNGNTALHECARCGRANVAQVLLQSEADPMAQTESGDFVLHTASYWNRAEVVELLLANSVDAGVKDSMFQLVYMETKVSALRWLRGGGIQVGRTAAQRTRSEEIKHLLRMSVGWSSCPRRFSSSQESSGGDDDDSAESTYEAHSYEWMVKEQSRLYETQWVVFLASKERLGNSISFNDVPWPGECTSSADIIRILLVGAHAAMQGPEERRKKLRAEMLRWHPDKFLATFGVCLKMGDIDQIMSLVNFIFQTINSAAKQN